MESSLMITQGVGFFYFRTYVRIEVNKLYCKIIKVRNSRVKKFLKRQRLVSKIRNEGGTLP